jgi:hypothetical protein
MRKAAQPQSGTRKAVQRQHAERGCAVPNAEGGAASAERGAASAQRGAVARGRRRGAQHAERRGRERTARRRRLDHRSSTNSLRYHPATAQAWDRWAMIRYRVNFPAYSAGKLTQIGIMDVAAAAKRGWEVRDSRPGTGDAGAAGPDTDAGPAGPGPGQEMRAPLAPATGQEMRAPLARYHTAGACSPPANRSRPWPGPGPGLKHG